MIRLRSFLIFLTLLAITGCTHRLPSPPGEGEVVTGLASYYAEASGRTASGEKFDANGMTAAHRTWPFGTRVRVTNLQNNRSVVVRINDRGPHRKDRIIDLSYGAAREIRMITDGVVKVRLEVLPE